MNRMFKLTLALLAVLALTGSALAQISEWHGGTVDKKGTSRFLHHQQQLPTTVALCGRAFSPRSKISRWHRRYLSSVRMRNDRHEQNGAKTQRPERIPIDPEHRSYSRNATAAVPIDSLLQNSRRREHDYAARRIRHLGADLRIAADTLTLLDFSCHSSVPFSFRIADHPACKFIGHWSVLGC